MNKVLIGIDVGGSTTKIAAFDGGALIAPILVRATDQITSAYGAFGKFTTENSLPLERIGGVIVTGVGSSFINKPIYGIPYRRAVEFDCVGRGGLYLTSLGEAIVVSMGTGTAIAYAKKTEEGVKTVYLGGTGVGGGTLMGLSRKLLGLSRIESIVETAKGGNLDSVDLRIKDISPKAYLSALSESLTASNFGKLSDMATNADIALGIINMVCETVAMLAVFAARGKGVRDIVLTGNLTTMPQAEQIFENLSRLFDVNFIIPENSQYATVIGAALA